MVTLSGFLILSNHRPLAETCWRAQYHVILCELKRMRRKGRAARRIALIGLVVLIDFAEPGIVDAFACVCGEKLELDKMTGTIG